MDCGVTDPLAVVLGASVLLRAGPFRDAAGALINLTGWTISLTLQDPNGSERAAEGTPSGTSDGYMTYTTVADELDLVDVWSARFQGMSGGVKRFSDLLTFRVVAVLP